MTQTIQKSEQHHYVDRVKFNEEATKYVNAYSYNKENNLPKPRMSNYLGECIILIANKASNMPSFVNYPFKDEMISDAIEIAFRYFHNYDENTISKRTGKKTAGAFAYVTRIATQSFVKRIKAEKLLMYTKQKYIANSWDMFIDIQEHDAENFTDELHDILQEMSGDEYKEYDAKVKLKHLAQQEETNLKNKLAEEINKELDIDEGDDIIDSLLETLNTTTQF